MPFEDDVFGISMWQHEVDPIVDLDTVHLFVEPRRGEMDPFNFDVMRPNKYHRYRGFDIPWLLLLAIPFSLFLLLKAFNHFSDDSDTSPRANSR